MASPQRDNVFHYRTRPLVFVFRVCLASVTYPKHGILLFWCFLGPKTHSINSETLPNHLVNIPYYYSAYNFLKMHKAIKENIEILGI